MDNLHQQQPEYLPQQCISEVTSLLERQQLETALVQRLLRAKFDKDPVLGTRIVLIFIIDAMGFLILLLLARNFLLQAMHRPISDLGQACGWNSAPEIPLGTAN